MHLAPSEFYRLLYSELALILEGYRARQAREIKTRAEEAAWIAAWHLMPHKNSDTPAPEFFRNTYNAILGRTPRSKPARKFADGKAAASAFFAQLGAKSKQEPLAKS